jgi:hypothetical protein
MYPPYANLSIYKLCQSCASTNMPTMCIYQPARSSIKHVPIKLLVGASSNVLEKYQSCINYRSTMMYNMITSSTHQPYVPIHCPIHMKNACTMISTYVSNNTSSDISMKLKYYQPCTPTDQHQSILMG